MDEEEEEDRIGPRQIILTALMLNFTELYDWASVVVQKLLRTLKKKFPHRGFFFSYFFHWTKCKLHYNNTTIIHIQ